MPPNPLLSLYDCRASLDLFAACLAQDWELKLLLENYAVSEQRALVFCKFVLM